MSPLADEETCEEREKRLRKELRERKRSEREKRHKMRARQNQIVSSVILVPTRFHSYSISD